jgi:hypothetical protein
MATSITTSNTSQSLIRSTYFGKDFQSYVNEIVDFVRLIYGESVATNIQASEQSLMLIEAVAFGLSTASWYGDRQADDLNFATVRVRHAAVMLARQLGYKPNPSVAPSVTLTLTLDTPPTISRLTLERDRQLTGPSGLTYLLNEEVIFDIGEVGPKEFTASEGVVIEEIFVGTGRPGQQFLLGAATADQGVVDSSPTVFVNNVEWREVEFLEFVEDTGSDATNAERNNQFELQYGFNPPRLVFGDGIAGNIPPVNADVRITYRTSSGTAGYSPAGGIDTFVAPLVTGIETLTGTVVQAEASTPGNDRETIASIRRSAPLAFAAADRAVTERDIEGIVASFSDPIFGSVALSRANVPRGIEADAEAQSVIAQLRTTAAGSGVDPAIFDDPINQLEEYWDEALSSNCQTNVLIVQIVAEDAVGRYVSAPIGLVRAIDSYLESRVESTVTVTIADGSVNVLRVDLEVGLGLRDTVKSETDRIAILNLAKNTLEAALLGRSYGQSLRISDLYTLLDTGSIDPNFNTNQVNLTIEEQEQLSQGIAYSQIRITKINDIDVVTDTPPSDPSLVADYERFKAKINSFGDLVIEEFEVLTLGTEPAVSILS